MNTRDRISNIIRIFEQLTDFRIFSLESRDKCLELIEQNPTYSNKEIAEILTGLY